ncbi:MAG: hypothetical protein MJ007_03070 [Paludibacteraceae bacterium]|nr:hypothetical protein [Paludibacteraceae bacterium]
MKKQVLVATMLTAVAMLTSMSTYAQSPTPTRSACASSTPETPSVKNPITGSTYNWGIDNGTEGTDWELTPKEGTGVSVTWLKPGTYTFWSQETSTYNCVGPKYVIDVVVESFTADDPAANNVCSILEDGTGGDIIGAILPTEGKCGGVVTQTIDKWIITSIDNIDKVTAAGTNAKLNEDLTSSDAISTDKYTNATTDVVELTYHITPYANGTEGAPFEVKASVYPQVKAPEIEW